MPTPLAQLAHTSLLISVFRLHRPLLAPLPEVMDGLRALKAHLGASRHSTSIARIAFVFVKAVYRYTNMAFHFRIHVARIASHSRQIVIMFSADILVGTTSWLVCPHAI